MAPNLKDRFVHNAINRLYNQRLRAKTSHKDVVGVALASNKESSQQKQHEYQAKRPYPTAKENSIKTTADDGQDSSAATSSSWWYH